MSGIDFFGLKFFDAFLENRLMRFSDIMDHTAEIGIASGDCPRTHDALVTHDA